MRSLEVDPLLLMLPVGLSCSLPFMLLGRKKKGELVSRLVLNFWEGDRFEGFFIGLNVWWGLWSRRMQSGFFLEQRVSGGKVRHLQVGMPIKP